MFTCHVLVQIGKGVFTQSVLHQHVRHSNQVACIFFSINRCPSLGYDAYTYFVFLESGRFHDDFGTVGKCPFRCVKQFVSLLSDNLTRCRELADEGFGLYIIHVRCNLFGIHFLHGLCQFIFCRDVHTFLVGKHTEHHLVMFFNQLSVDLIHRFHRYLVDQHVHQLIFLFDAWKRFVTQEVIDAGLYQLVVFLLVPVLVFLFQCREVFASHTGIFRSGESMTLDAECFPIECFQGRLDVGSFGKTCQRQGLLGRNKEVAVYTLCYCQWRFLLHHQFVETVSQHMVNHLHQILVGQVAYVVLLGIGDIIVFEIQLDDCVGLFLVLFNADNGFLVVCYRVTFPFRSIGWCLNRRKHFLYLLFDAVDVYITYYNNALQVGTIPVLIVISQ